MTALVMQGDAMRIGLRPGSVSLVVSSPPYWGLRTYEDFLAFCRLLILSGQLPPIAEWDGTVHLHALALFAQAGQAYEGQVGSEDSPVLFLRNLWAVMDQTWEVLADEGLACINLGDKYAGAGGHNNSNLTGASVATGLVGARPAKQADRRNHSGTSSAGSTLQSTKQQDRGGRKATLAARAAVKSTRRQAPDRYLQGTEWARAKSLMGLPHAFALGLINPALYRDHLDPPPCEPCPTCDGTGRGDVRAAPCPTCLGERTVAGQHPQWIKRADLVWDKPNGMPDSADDRPRRTHEDWFVFAKQGDHYAAMDTVREEFASASLKPGKAGTNFAPGRAKIPGRTDSRTPYEADEARGKLPGSVRTVAAEPFTAKLYHLDNEGGRVLDAKAVWAEASRRVRFGGPPLLVRPAEHFAPFPTEWPRFLIRAFSPQEVCTVCERGRFPVTERTLHVDRPGRVQGRSGDNHERAHGQDGRMGDRSSTEARIVGWACACTPTDLAPPAGKGWGDGDTRRGARAAAAGTQGDYLERPERRTYLLDGWDPPPATASVVLDPFGGTGTTALVASALGRVGISLDLSWDYCRTAEWRCASPKQRTRIRRRTNAEAAVPLFT